MNEPTKPVVITWRADRSGEGHAYPSRGRHAALCGQPWMNPMFDWPIRQRHAVCRDLVDAQKAAR